MTQTQATSAPKIRLYKANGSWIAQFVGDAEVIRLFGTDSIPTCYTDKADAGRVWQDITERNPGAIVDVGDGPVRMAL